MGQYLQMGICYDFSVYKSSSFTTDDIADMLSKDVDISLYTCHETEKAIHFQINEQIVMEQLHDFTKFQFSLYYSKNSSYEKELTAISNSSSLQELIQLAKKYELGSFQNSEIVYTYYQVPDGQGSIRINVSMFTMFYEGKIIMEGYNSFLKYLENVIRTTSQQWSISRAFRCFIQ
jgi:hypothetical protein